MNNKVITNKNFKKLVEVLEQKRQNDFNIFKVLRLENYEVRHSNFLAWLFDNAASHKMGITFFGIIGQFLKNLIPFYQFQISLVEILKL